jgi:hypothetical protein
MRLSALSITSGAILLLSPIVISPTFLSSIMPSASLNMFMMSCWLTGGSSAGIGGRVARWVGSRPVPSSPSGRIVTNGSAPLNGGNRMIPCPVGRVTRSNAAPSRPSTSSSNRSPT